MAKPVSLPVALTVAGSDSGGGAGIQADLKTFAALGVHGTCAITCVTAQNPSRVSAIEKCSPRLVGEQMEAVFAGFHPRAVKTGMLYSAEIIRGVVAHLKRHRKAHNLIPLVVDPVMIATSGRRLLRADAIKALRDSLLPLATLITPNLDETSVLVGRPVRSVEDMRSAARELRANFGAAVLVKGGHLRGAAEAADIFFDGATELLLTAPFVKGVRTHGTGCVYSAAITAQLARGHALPGAVIEAKKFISRAIVQRKFADGHLILGLSGN
jgi:hydroxymethylpyrimidine/phosphomethylpyrimidine kinase